MIQEKNDVVVTLNNKGQCVLVSRQDEEGQILSVIWEYDEAEAQRIIKQNAELEALYPKKITAVLDSNLGE